MRSAIYLGLAVVGAALAVLAAGYWRSGRRLAPPGRVFAVEDHEAEIW